MANYNWKAFDEEMPVKGESVIVTNNLEATNRWGHKSHIWLTDFPQKSSERPGEIICFDECDREVRFLTHWRYAFETPEIGISTDDLVKKLEATNA